MPVPVSTVTLPAPPLPPFATTRSALASLLKFSSDSETGFAPTSDDCGVFVKPLLVPMNVLTEPALLFRN